MLFHFQKNYFTNTIINFETETKAYFYSYVTKILPIIDLIRFNELKISINLFPNLFQSFQNFLRNVYSYKERLNLYLENTIEI